MDLPKNEMKRCEVCGDDDLEFINGEITCRMCGTQCTTQQTAVVLDETVQFRYLTQIKGPSQSAARGSTGHEKAHRPLPWKLSEAFQIILFAQARAIHSKLALSKDYFEMVVQIWIRYLKATGEAFLSEKDRLTTKYPHGWGQIYDPSKGAENISRPIKRIRFYKRKTAPNPQRQRELLDSERTLREMDFEDSHNPFSDIESNSKVSDTSDSDIDTSDLSSVDNNVRPAVTKAPPPKPVAKKNEKRYWRGWCGEEVGCWFLLEYNLAVCFLPLLYLRSNGRPFGLADLLDLVRRHLVPFQNARAVLPPSFVIHDTGIANCFKRVRAAPTRQRMIRVTRLLLDLLNMKQLPRFPLLSHIALRTDQLQLPAGVSVLARRLALRWLTDIHAAPWAANKTVFERRVPDANAVCPDIVAMTFVVLMLFSIRGDDFVEAQWRQALVQRLREASGRPDLFLWTEWAPRVAKVRRLGKSVTSIEDASGFVDLPNVGLLIQEDFSDSAGSDDDDDEMHTKLGRTRKRAVQPHEHLLLIKKTAYVKDLMAPFQPLIEGDKEREKAEHMQENGMSLESDFKEHLLCYPVESATLEVLLGKQKVSSGSSSPLLFSQDIKSEPENSRAARIKEALDRLPTHKALEGNVMRRLPADPPADFKEVVALCAQCIFAKPADLWTTAKQIQLSLMHMWAEKNGKKLTALNQKPARFPLKWRTMFNPA